MFLAELSSFIRWRELQRSSSRYNSLGDDLTQTCMLQWQGVAQKHTHESSTLRAKLGACQPSPGMACLSTDAYPMIGRLAVVLPTLYQLQSERSRDLSSRTTGWREGLATELICTPDANIFHRLAGRATFSPSSCLYHVSAVLL